MTYIFDILNDNYEFVQTQFFFSKNRPLCEYDQLRVAIVIPLDHSHLARALNSTSSTLPFNRCLGKYNNVAHARRTSWGRKVRRNNLTATMPAGDAGT